MEKAEHSLLFIKLIFPLNNREKTNTGKIHLESEINREMHCLSMVCNILDQKTHASPWLFSNLYLLSICWNNKTFFFSSYFGI